MKVLNRTALGGLLRLVASLAGALFLPAWTLHYWQAWIFLAVFSVSVLAITTSWPEIRADQEHEALRPGSVSIRNVGTSGLCAQIQVVKEHSNERRT